MRGYFASCVVFFRAPKGQRKIRAMSKTSACNICKTKEKEIYYSTTKRVCYICLLFSGKSVEIHPALSVHQYMARAKGVNNTESQ